MATLKMFKKTKNCKSNMLKWIYSDADTTCDYGKKTHTMDNLVKCSVLSQECTIEDLMGYNEAAKECVFQCMNNMTRRRYTLILLRNITGTWHIEKNCWYATSDSLRSTALYQLFVIVLIACFCNNSILDESRPKTIRQ